jgi:hypothetical protein
MVAERVHGKLLSDEPQDDESQDRFSHSTYVDVIIDTISHCDTPHNLGVFGKWGTGKSTILKFLAKRITTNPELTNRYEYFYLDAWKLTVETFRQQVLESLNAHFGGKVKNIENTLWNILESGKETSVEVDLPSLISVVVLVGLAVIGTTLKLAWGIDISNFLLVAITAALLVVLRTLSKASIRLAVSTKKIIPQMQSPQQFEELFRKIIDHRGNKSLIIAIDNLDRCDSKLAVEMLGTIKTFMNVKGCFYLIACDDIALEAQVASERYPSGGPPHEAVEDDAKEFLRKFFQTSIKVAPFLEGSLRQFAQEQNGMLPRQFEEQVLFVITTAFRKNPRRIKQFLNNLYVVYQACELRENLRVIRPGQITSNFAFMAKILVLRDEWPRFHVKLQDTTILWKIENYFRGQVDEALAKLLDEEPELKSFLQATRNIWADNVEPFLLVSQESYESSIPEAERLKLWITASDHESVRAFVSPMDDVGKGQVTDFILKTLAESLLFGRKGEVENILLLIPKVYDQVPPKNRAALADRFGNALSRSPHTDVIERFQLDDLFLVLTDSSRMFRNGVLEKLVPRMRKEKQLDTNLFEALIAHHTILDRPISETVRSTLGDLYSDNEETILSRFKEIASDKSASEVFVDSRIMRRIAESITRESGEDLAGILNQARVRGFMRLRWLADKDDKGIFVARILAMIGETPPPKIESYVDIPLQILGELDPSEVPASVMPEIAHSLSKLCIALSDQTEKTRVIHALLRFTRAMDAKCHQIVRAELIDPLFQAVGADLILQILQLCHEYEVPILSEDSTVKVVLDRISSGLPDVSLIKYVIQNTTGLQREKTVQVLADVMMKAA